MSSATHMSHRNLALPEKMESFKEYFENLEIELSGCKETINKKLNLEVKYLAYPYGDHQFLGYRTGEKIGIPRGPYYKTGGQSVFHPQLSGKPLRGLWRL